MKILIIQLARFGDIFLTWPVLRALKRQFPEAEIHLAARRRFKAAADGCEALTRVWELDTPHILGPLLERTADYDVPLTRLEEWVESLSREKFTRVINLSFSPFSSYLTWLLADRGAEVAGYTRHPDGFLNMADDPSAYFYAQVGIGRANRYHLGEIFAAVASTDLQQEDWRAPKAWSIDERLVGWRGREPRLQEPYLVLHPGASQSGKIFPAFKWQRVVKRLLSHWRGTVVLIGTEAEKNLAAEISLGQSESGVLNLIGQTDFADALAIISGAQLLVGADSAPMHLASFAATPCLNLSFSAVSFWETGPRVVGSRIVVSDSPETLPSDRVSDELVAMVEGRVTHWPVVVRVKASPVGYEWRERQDDKFAWDLINAIYSGGQWPVVEDSFVASGFWQLREAVRLARQQLPLLVMKERRKLANELIEQVDLTLGAIARSVPQLRPLIAWFETERIRLGPSDIETLMQKTSALYDQLIEILDMYLRPFDQSKEVQP